MGKKRGLLGSITRLALGGVLVVVEELDARLPRWETEKENFSEKFASEGQEGRKISAQVMDVTNSLVGAVLILEDRIEDRIDSIDRLTRKGANRTKRLLQPFTSSWFGKRIANRMDRLSARGEREINRLLRYGHSEAKYSKDLFRTAVGSSVDQVVSDFSDNKEIQQLVQAQGVSLAEEIVEEVRERAISADEFLETVTRSVLKRPSRDQLPGPPPEVKAQVKSARQIKRRISG